MHEIINEVQLVTLISTARSFFFTIRLFLFAAVVIIVLHHTCCPCFTRSLQYKR